MGSALIDALKPPAAKPCKVGRLLAALDKVEADAVREALADGTPTAWIARALTTVEPVSESVVYKHRSNECRCS